MTTHAMKKRHLKMAAVARDGYRWLDSEVERTKPSAVRCTKGCSACCYQLVIITVPEALAIASKYPALVDRKRHLLEAQRELLMAVCRANDLRTEGAPITDPAIRNRLTAVWWEQHEPCAFLAQDGTCEIYEARPLACRAYHVTSDPEICGRADTGNEVDIWDVPQWTTVLEGLAQAFMQIYGVPEHAVGSLFQCGSLPGIVLDARRLLHG